MNDVKNIYNLELYLEGTIANFAVDDKSMKSFENWLKDGDGEIKFTDLDDKGEVVLKKKKTICGYKKSIKSPLFDPGIFQKE